MAAQPKSMGYVKFALGIPQTVTFASLDGVPCRGFNDEPQLRYKLSDGRAMFVGKDFPLYLKDQGVRPGQLVTITKQRGKDGRNLIWIVRPVDQRPGVELTWAGQKIAGVLDSVKEDYHDGTATVDAVPQTRLSSALKTAVQAAKDAEAFGQTIGYNVRFRPEDIRALGISVHISMGNR